MYISSVWPEKNSSAAGVRNWSLIEIMLNSNWDIYFFSISKKNQYTKELEYHGIQTYHILPNDSFFDQYIKEIQPNIVLFDQFIIEEQFGWRIHNTSPNTILLLDTQDLHFLRFTREKALKEGKSLKEIINIKPSFYFTSDFSIKSKILREISSIYRCDHSFVVSTYEKDLLINEYHIPKEKISLSSFYYSIPNLNEINNTFENREHFAVIGNHRHPPNQDQLNWLVFTIWPLIRLKIPNAKLFIYGAYPTKITQSFQNESIGIYNKGQIANVLDIFSKHRVNLAPLRFGAGIKGKIADGWMAGTPCVTTSIGAEGMIIETYNYNNWGGIIADTVEEFVNGAVELYLNESLWKISQMNGFKILDELFNKEKNSILWKNKIEEIIKNIHNIRSNNIIGEILWFHYYRSTEWFSKYIEIKEKFQNKSL